MIVGLLFIACLQVVHNSCNMGTRSLSNIYVHTPSTLRPAALVLWAHISGKPLMPMLQLRYSSTAT